MRSTFDPKRPAPKSFTRDPSTIPQVFSRYELLERIGAGGTAEVFRALASSDGQAPIAVAIKRARGRSSRDPRTALSFTDEARILGALDHHGIVRVLDSGTMDDAPFIAFERIDGADAATLLRAARLPLDCALAVVAETLDALEHAHSAGHGIVHRDVTPANVLLSTKGETKLTDFGIALADDRASKTTTGKVRGTFLYMAPEQLANGLGPVDARTDVYGAAMTALHLVCGAHPLAGERTSRVVDRILRGDIPAPSAVDPKLPKELDAILLKARHPLRERRYRSAAEFREAILRIAAAHRLESSGLALGEWVSAHLIRAKPAKTAPVVFLAEVGKRGSFRRVP